MIFISSKIPLTEIESLTLNEIRNKTDWFLFDYQIRNKKYWKDNNLYHMYNRLYWYPIFYKHKLYNYLMSDNYYFRSNLYKMMENHAQIICMKRVKNFDEIKDYDREDRKTEFLEKKISKRCLITLREIILKRILFVNMYLDR